MPAGESSTPDASQSGAEFDTVRPCRDSSPCSSRSSPCRPVATSPPTSRSAGTTSSAPACHTRRPRPFGRTSGVRSCWSGRRRCRLIRRPVFGRMPCSTPASRRSWATLPLGPDAWATHLRVADAATDRTLARWPAEPVRPEVFAANLLLDTRPLLVAAGGAVPAIEGAKLARVDLEALPAEAAAYAAVDALVLANISLTALAGRDAGGRRNVGPRRRDALALVVRRPGADRGRVAAGGAAGRGGRGAARAGRRRRRPRPVEVGGWRQVDTSRGRWRPGTVLLGRA